MNTQSTITIREICVEDCSNGVDDDNDGLADCEDRDCIDFFRDLNLQKSSGDTLVCDVFRDFIADTVQVWGACIDLLSVDYIDTIQISLDSISCIQYEVISGACSGSEGNCESGVLCTMDTCQYYISLIGHQDQVIS